MTENVASRVQLVAVLGVILGLILCLVGIIVLSWQGANTPDVLDVTTGALAGALAGLLMPRR